MMPFARVIELLRVCVSQMSITDRFGHLLFNSSEYLRKGTRKSVVSTP